MFRKTTKAQRDQVKAARIAARERTKRRTKEDALRACFAFIAVCDAPLSEEEIEFIRHYASENHLSSEWVGSFTNDKFRAVSNEALSRTLAGAVYLCFSSLVAKRRLIEDLLELSAVDGGPTPEEDDAVRGIARMICLDFDKFDRLRRSWANRNSTVDSTSKLSGRQSSPRKRRKATPWYYQTLECTPEDKDETIKRAYRRLATQLHPDKFGPNQTPEETEIHVRRFQELQAAYELVRRHREGGQ